MGDKSKIEWTDASWNPTRGCSLVSPGCTNCYAMKVAGGVAKQAYAGLTRKSGGRTVWTGAVRLVPEKLGQPLRWRRPRRIFVDSMSDLFHEDVPDDYIDQVFAVMALAQHHTFQVLTKRPERMADYMAGRDWEEAANAAHDEYIRALSGPMYHMGEIVPPLPNVWLGTSVEDQPRADERIPHLLRTPAAVRFLSCEPLLGPIELDEAFPPCCNGTIAECGCDGESACGFDWIIVGGESGPAARFCDVSWIRSIRDQCRAVGVPVFVKQLGARPIAYGTTTVDGLRNIRDSHGGDPNEWPADLRIREFPREPVHA